MPKLLPKNNALEEQWLDEAVRSEPGTELYLPTEDKKTQRLAVKKIIELRDKMGRDDPVTASKIDISPVYRDRQFWVMIKHNARSPLVGYKKSADGTIEKVTITVDPERRRKIKLMVADGVPLDEINDSLSYPLTKSEIREFIQKGRFS